MLVIRLHTQAQRRDVLMDWILVERILIALYSLGRYQESPRMYGMQKREDECQESETVCLRTRRTRWSCYQICVQQLAKEAISEKTQSIKRKHRIESTYSSCIFESTWNALASAMGPADNAAAATLDRSGLLSAWVVWTTIDVKTLFRHSAFRRLKGWAEDLGILIGPDCLDGPQPRDKRL